MRKYGGRRWSLVESRSSQPQLSADTRLSTRMYVQIPPPTRMYACIQGILSTPPACESPPQPSAAKLQAGRVIGPSLLSRTVHYLVQTAAMEQQAIA